MTSPPPDREHEELEHIPWSMLAGELDRGRSQTLIGVGIVLVLVAVVVFVGVRSLRRAPGTIVEVPGGNPEIDIAAPLPAAPAPAQPALPPAPPEVESTATSMSPALYSEADLMAVAPEQEQRWVAARAEWFVTEHFTVDGEDASGSATWVEWARTAQVTPTSPGGYEVVVVFSTLVQSAAGDFSRSGLRAVTVPLEIGAAGDVLVADLPSPVEYGGWDGLDPEPAGDAELPPEVVAAAVELGQTVGPEVVVVGGSTDGEAWRVIIEVAEPPGPAVPLVVAVPR